MVKPRIAITAATILSACCADAFATDMGMGMGSPPVVTYFSVDRLEARLTDGDDVIAWEAEGWLGGDINKLFFRSKGEVDEDGSAENAELQLLYSRAVLPFWDLQVGLRHDLRPNPSKSYAVASLEGLAPYRIEVLASAFLSEDGDASARLELEYDLALTQRWILQPRTEFDFAFSQVADLDVGRGPRRLESGLRLRYQITPAFAPYLGINHETALGNTRSLLNDSNESRSDWSFVLGLSSWF